MPLWLIFELRLLGLVCHFQSLFVVASVIPPFLGGGGCGINDGKSFERDLDYLLTFSFLVPAD